MQQIGDRVVYGIHGICQIIALEHRLVDKKMVEYYVLEPIEQPGARFYVPTQNQVAVAKLRKLLTLEQIEEILASDVVSKRDWIDDENKRKQHFREVLTGGDRAAVLCMINNLYRHKLTQAAAGRKFHLSDETFLHDAQKMLRSEFSVILGIPQSQVDDYILSKIQKK